MEDLRKLQLKELEILEQFKKICEEHALTYYLTFGTLLGAVRHKGFIPWDDDIDVMMPIRDMEKLERIYQKEKWSGLFLQTPNTEPEAGLTYYKLRMDGTTLLVDRMINKDIHHGIDIDIYPLYNVPENRLLWTIQYGVALLYMLLQTEESPINHGKAIQMASNMVLSVCKGKFRETVRDFCYRYMAKYEGCQTLYKAILSCNPMIAGQRYPQNVFQESVEMSFEDGVFLLPAGYDEWLTLQYGNYMELPPVEEQGCKLEHIIKMNTDKSYLEYKGKYYLCGGTGR